MAVKSLMTHDSCTCKIMTYIQKYIHWQQQKVNETRHS